jgi:hypothetical protein
MRGKIIKIFIVILFIICMPVVRADNDCNYSVRAELTKLAKNVTAAYEIKQRDDGTYYVEINIYNIVDGIYVEYRYANNTKRVSSSVNDSHSVFPMDTNNGTYTIEDNDITQIKKYTFSIRASNGTCLNNLRKFTLTKPKYNELSEINSCKYIDIQDYMYCQEWITQDFNLTKEEVEERIEIQREKNRKTASTECLNCNINQENDEWYQRILKIKKYVIIGLSIGILTDLVFIVLMIKKIREDRI